MNDNAQTPYFGHDIGDEEMPLEATPQAARSVGLGYVRCAEGVSKDWIASGDWHIEVGGERSPARAGLRALL